MPTHTDESFGLPIFRSTLVLDARSIPTGQRPALLGILQCFASKAALPGCFREPHDVHLHQLRKCCKLQVNQALVEFCQAQHFSGGFVGLWDILLDKHEAAEHVKCLNLFLHTATVALHDFHSLGCSLERSIRMICRHVQLDHTVPNFDLLLVQVVLFANGMCFPAANLSLVEAACSCMALGLEQPCTCLTLLVLILGGEFLGFLDRRHGLVVVASGQLQLGQDPETLRLSEGLAKLPGQLQALCHGGLGFIQLPVVAV
mmetsp:Transcript_48778/g.114545  ORF Transcript_48778/g.114545 Transcript_48778/m.114545 type:complete len:259 (+) Transcript_48778:735-1511(+)